VKETAPGPLYHQILRILASRIQSGVYPTGSQLPTEGALMEEFNVSRATVRTAVGHLTTEGMVQRTAGKGTFVTARLEAGFDWSIESIEDLVDRAPDLRYEVQSYKLIPAEKDQLAASRLQLEDRSMMVRVEGCRTLSGKPYAYTVARFPADIGVRLPQDALASESFTMLIERHCGLVANEVRQVVSAAPADRTTAKALGLRMGDAILLFERTFLDERGRPLQFATLAYRPDRYQQRTRLFRRRAAGQMRRLSVT
jgi:GntR family transcriptional regulator